MAYQKIKCLNCDKEIILKTKVLDEYWAHSVTKKHLETCAPFLFKKYLDLNKKRADVVRSIESMFVKSIPNKEERKNVIELWGSVKC